MKNNNIKTFDQHLDERYGKIGTEERVEFEIKAKAFAIRTAHAVHILGGVL